MQLAVEITKYYDGWFDLVNGGLFAKEHGDTFEQSKEEREGYRATTFDACSDYVGM